jgi:hypothetical protein
MSSLSSDYQYHKCSGYRISGGAALLKTYEHPHPRPMLTISCAVVLTQWNRPQQYDTGKLTLDGIQLQSHRFLWNCRHDEDSERAMYRFLMNPSEQLVEVIGRLQGRVRLVSGMGEYHVNSFRVHLLDAMRQLSPHFETALVRMTPSMMESGPNPSKRYQMGTDRTLWLCLRVLTVALHVDKDDTTHIDVRCSWWIEKKPVGENHASWMVITTVHLIA